MRSTAVNFMIRSHKLDAPANAEAGIMEQSTMKGNTAIPNAVNCLPTATRLPVIPIIFPIPLMKSATVNIMIAPTKIPIPLAACSFTVCANAIKGEIAIPNADKSIPIFTRFDRSRFSTNADIRAATISPIPEAILIKISIPVSKNFSKTGNVSNSAPIATANAPVASIKTSNAANAATPINANGPTRAKTANITVSVFIRFVRASRFVMAFGRSSIHAISSININNGTARAVNARTPSKAPTTKLPIMVKGIRHNVNTPTNMDRARTLSKAFFIPSIEDRICTNKNSGNAITVSAKTPLIALPQRSPMMVNGNNSSVIAAITPINAIILPVL